MPGLPAPHTRLPHVYWLGGGSGAGKSTVAHRLAATHDMMLYSTDDAMADHGTRHTPENCPRLEAFKRVSMDERWADRTPAEMLETFHWFQGEGFDMILEDLRAMPRDRRVIVEGFRLLPRLVQPALAASRQALWLLPTPAFRRAAFETRGTLWDIPNKTSRPEQALQNLLARDAMFTDQLREECAELGLPTFEVDGSLSEDALIDAVENQLGLSRTGR